MNPYEFGDARPIVKVCFDRDGWEWFLQVARNDLGRNDTFLKDVEDANDRIAPLEEPDDE